MKIAKRREVPGANLFHDRVNLICLPVLAAMSAAGLMGWYSPEKVEQSSNVLLSASDQGNMDFWAEYSTMPTTAYLPRSPAYLPKATHHHDSP